MSLKRFTLLLLFCVITGCSSARKIKYMPIMRVDDIGTSKIKFTFEPKKLVKEHVRVLKEKPKNQILQASLVGIYASMNKLKHSAYYTQKALFQKKDNIYAQKQVLWSSLVQKKYDSAKLIARRILQFDGGNVDVLNILASLYYMEGDLERAIELWEQGSETNKESLGLSLNLAMIAMQNRNFTKALEIYEKLPLDDIPFPDVWVNLGVIYASQSKVEEAKEAFDKAMQVDPDDGVTLLNMGIFEYFVEKNPESAVSYFQDCLDRTKGNELLNKVASQYIKVIEESQRVNQTIEDVEQ